MTQEQMERAIAFILGEGARLDQRIGTLVTVTNQDAETIRLLAGIAESHERRITRLEGVEE
jgi:hypothetical protein